ncbi:MAG TPA: DUF3280 domain-containing protein [Hyphomicrobiaceae bacterium]|nr:DUF3280 domain-containing protein [Hyphomicrobiaceae bacterium]
MVRNLASLIAALALVSSVMIFCVPQALGAQRIVVFPFEIIDVTRGSGPMGYELGGGLPTGPDQDEMRRLKIISDDLVARIIKDGRYQPVGGSELMSEVEKLGPIYKCNGCEDDIAKRFAAPLALIATVEKLSDLLFNFNLYLRDVAHQKVVSIMSTTIQGSTDEAWLRGVRYLAERKLLQPGEAK